MTKPRSFTFAVLVTTLMLAGLAGYVFGQVRPASKAESDVDAGLKNFSAVLALVEENYANDVDGDTAVYGAIAGMLRTLDPHSRFMDPKSFASSNEDLRGKYYGLGISVNVRFGQVTIVSAPLPGSPAEKVGLRVADVIAKVNGEPTEGVDLSAVIAKIKGPRGTSVHLSIRRPGADELIEMDAIRDEIAKFTVSNSFLIRPGVGYIKLDSFADTSGREVREAIQKLHPAELNGLIFDLRGNPGGVLPAAIDIGETFLQKGQSILETKGRVRGSNKTYVSQKTNADNLFPLVVLVNDNSASASEIVSGAIQDHDRGLIVGETSFGKGLVQSVFELTNHSGLALTTQKWYTPSGRLIQRDYSEISQFDYFNHRDSATKKPAEVKRSDTGRTVRGGGGITPDYIVEEPQINEFQQRLASRYVFYTFGRDVLKAEPNITKSYQVTDAVLNEFKQHLSKRGIAFSDAEFQENRDFLKRSIRYEIMFDRFGTTEAVRSLLDYDPQVLKALELMPEAKQLSEKAYRLAGRR